MKITKHLINILFLSFLLYAPFSFALSSYPASPIGWNIADVGFSESCNKTRNPMPYSTGTYTYSSKGFGTCTGSLQKVERFCRSLGSGCADSDLYVYYGVNPCTSNSTYSNGICTANSGFNVVKNNDGSYSVKTTNEECTLPKVYNSQTGTCDDPPVPNCEAPYAYDAVTNSCQLTACPVGFERVPPSTSCTPIQCTPPTTLNDEGFCTIPECPLGYTRLNGVCTRDCPNLQGQATESLYCNFWHEVIDGCRYNAESIVKTCANSDYNAPFGGVPLVSCKNTGKLSAGYPDSSAFHTDAPFHCDANAPSTDPLTVTLGENTSNPDKPNQDTASQSAETKSTETETKLLQDQAAAKAAAEAAAAAAKAAADAAAAQTASAAQTAADVATAAAQTAAQTLNTAQLEYNTAQQNLNSNPTDSAAQSAFQTASTNLAAAQQSSNQATATAAASQAYATQVANAVAAGGGGAGGSGSGGGGCGDLACETTLQMVRFDTKSINELLSGVGVNAGAAVSGFDSLDATMDSHLTDFLESFNTIDISSKFNSAFETILPESPFQKLKNSANASCTFEFPLMGHQYTLSICESLPFLHPALTFILGFILVVFLFNLVFERPRG